MSVSIEFLRRSVITRIESSEELHPLLLSLARKCEVAQLAEIAIEAFTSSERLTIGAALPTVIGIRCEAMLAGVDPGDLSCLLESEDAAALGEIVTVATA